MLDYCPVECVLPLPPRWGTAETVVIISDYAEEYKEKVVDLLEKFFQIVRF